MDDLEAREQVARIDGLLEQVEGFADPATARRRTSSWRRCSTSTARGSRGSWNVFRTGPALAEDELVSHLLLLHGIHPQPVEERVRERARRGAPVSRVPRR